MTRLIHIILLVSFLSIAVFGFAGIGHQGCLATISKGPACIAQNVFSAANFHVGVFKSFSLAILLTLTLAAAMVMVLLWRLTSNLSSISSINLPSRRVKFLAAFGMTGSWLPKLRFWYALHERRAVDALNKGALLKVSYL